MNQELKKHLVSGVITFLAGFALFVGPALQDMDAETLTKGSIVSLAFAGVRAGVKLLAEMLFIKHK